MIIRLNPGGFCECGCGQKAPIAKRTALKYGRIKGYPIRFVKGHNCRAQRRFPVPYLIDESTGCWVWQWYVNPAGYGKTYNGKRMVSAHRHYYQQAKGEIPPELVLDHLCRNRACVNPEHLEPVTHRENVLRGDGIAAKRVAQTSCVNGHPFTEDNTVWVEGRTRRCRECQRLARRSWQRQRNAELREERKKERELLGSKPQSPVDYVVDETTGCWVWQRCIAPDGYGVARFQGPKMSAHRAYYLLYKGSIPDGLVLDHLCRNRVCVNPEHLEPVTHQENVRRGLQARRGGEP